MNGSKVLTLLVIGVVCLLMISVAGTVLSLISGILGLFVSLVSGLLHLAVSKAGLTLILIAIIVYSVGRSRRPSRYHY